MNAPSLLAEWLAAEAAQQERFEAGAGFGVARPEQVEGLDGLAQMQAMLRGELPAPLIARTMDFVLIEVDRGRAVFQGRPGAQFLNPLGTVHGGWFATLLDSALGCAVQTALPAGRSYTTAEIGIHLVRAITPQLERVRAEGEVVHCGRQLATATARLVGPDGKLYAHASTTCLVFEVAAAKRS
jgi:uncharacterized protein (TIGR00369 family)